MITDNFSWIRIGMLLKRYFSQNRRSLLMVLAVFFGIMLFTGCMTSRYLGDDQSDRTPVYWVFAAILSMFAITISASLTFNSMSSKPKRITEMMVPATKFEKFFSCIVVYVFIAPIAILASALVADALASVLFGLAPAFVDLFHGIGNMLKDISAHKLDKEDISGITVILMAVCSVIAYILLGQGWYVLGSALWPRKSFIKTSLVLLAVQMILPIIMPWEWLGNTLFGDYYDNWTSMQIVLYLWMWIAIFYAIDFGIFYLAWRRFKRTQLVQKFMMD